MVEVPAFSTVFVTASAPVVLLWAVDVVVVEVCQSTPISPTVEPRGTGVAVVCCFLVVVVVEPSGFGAVLTLTVSCGVVIGLADIVAGKLRGMTSAPKSIFPPRLARMSFI